MSEFVEITLSHLHYSLIILLLPKWLLITVNLRKQLAIDDGAKYQFAVINNRNRTILTPFSN